MIDAILSAPVFLLAFLFVISIVVVFHELGHYWAARLCGVHAETFSIGFGPALVKWHDRRGTQWQIAAFPVGGYVRFLGDADASSAPNREEIEALRRKMAAEHTPERGVFHLQPVWRRAVIVAAGPVANLALAIVIFALLFGIFGSQTQLPVIGGVEPDSPAEAAGFASGDRILSVDGRRIVSFGDIVDVVLLSAGDTLTFTVDRGGEQFALAATPARTARPDPIGGEMNVGFLGIQSTGESVTRHYNPVEAVAMGADQTWGVIAGTGRYVGRIFAGKESADMLGGPVRIATYSGRLALDSFTGEASFGQEFRAALVRLISLAGVLSVGLGLINLLPVPVLDGGHLLYYGFEAASGRPLSERAQALGFKAGLALVASLMLFATWNDLNYLRSFFS